jgi:hypothetical protein
MLQCRGACCSQPWPIAYSRKLVSRKNCFEHRECGLRPVLWNPVPCAMYCRIFKSRAPGVATPWCYMWHGILDYSPGYLAPNSPGAPALVCRKPKRLHPPLTPLCWNLQRRHHQAMFGTKIQKAFDEHTSNNTETLFAGLALLTCPSTSPLNTITRRDCASSAYRGRRSSALPPTPGSG